MALLSNVVPIPSPLSIFKPGSLSNTNPTVSHHHLYLHHAPPSGQNGNQINLGTSSNGHNGQIPVGTAGHNGQITVGTAGHNGQGQVTISGQQPLATNQIPQIYSSSNEVAPASILEEFSPQGKERVLRSSREKKMNKSGFELGMFLHLDIILFHFFAVELMT